MWSELVSLCAIFTHGYHSCNHVYTLTLHVLIALIALMAYGQTQTILEMKAIWKDKIRTLSTIK